MKDVLYVPINVEALVVNEKEKKSHEFLREGVPYNNVENFIPVHTNENTPQPLTTEKMGVYLHWNLPAALCEGQQNNETGETTFPLIPNRWLLIRINGKDDKRASKSWIIESDTDSYRKGTIDFIKPNAVEFERTRIGKKIELEEWENNVNEDLFLTAIGAGDIAFSAFQPYNENVLSMHDDLDGIADKDQLSYFVTGWYSDPDKDFIHTYKNLNEALIAFNWSVLGETENRTIEQSFYHGAIFDIPWNRKEGNYPSDKPQSNTITGQVNYAVGNNSVDALMALIRNGETSLDADLLEAFQHNLLENLNQPNGQFVLNQEIHKNWFGTHAGGLQYKVSKLDGREYRQVTNHYDPDWLYELNKKQQHYESKVKELQDLQYDLYRLWFTRNRYENLDEDAAPDARIKPHLPFKEEDLDMHLDPRSENEESTARKTVALSQEIATLQTEIPFGTTEEAYLNSLKQYAEEHNILEGYKLQVNRSKAYKIANEPTIFFSGVKSPKYEDKVQLCRFSDQLIKTLKSKDNSVQAEALEQLIPMAQSDHLPEGITHLYAEFLLLDKDNAPCISTHLLSEVSEDDVRASIKNRAYEESNLPGFNLSDWSQPWLPLLLQWKIRYYPISYEGNWVFDNGQYVWNGKGSDADQYMTYNGRTLLTPTSTFNFSQRLKEFKEKMPDITAAKKEQIDTLLEKIEDWDFISQKLEGLYDLMACNDIGASRYPFNNEIASLIGDMNRTAPLLGTISKNPEENISDFLDLRSGQFYFTNIVILDAFGRCLQVVHENNERHVMPVLSKDLTPDKFVFNQSSERLIQLRPRLLQSCHLKFDFLSDKNDEHRIDHYSNTNPVCAWVIPNHLDKTFAFYDNKGAPLGKIRIIVNGAGEKETIWEKSIGSAYDTFETIEAEFQHLGQFAKHLLSQGSEVFQNFFITIDKTLWHIDPLGDRENKDLTVLLGRPLALVRTRLMYDLEEAPLTDRTWNNALAYKNSEFVEYNFPVLLGGAELRNDGLIGYFKESEYDRFNAAHIPKGINKGEYLHHINNENLIDLKIGSMKQTKLVPDSVRLTLLIDPRAKVYATTSILPTDTLELPYRFITEAFSNMEATFKVDALLTNQLVEETDEPQENKSYVTLPIPAEKRGTWTFTSLEQKEWKEYELFSSTKTEDQNDSRPKIKSGHLKLNN